MKQFIHLLLCLFFCALLEQSNIFAQNALGTLVNIAQKSQNLNPNDPGAIDELWQNAGTGTDQTSVIIDPSVYNIPQGAVNINTGSISTVAGTSNHSVSGDGGNSDGMRQSAENESRMANEWYEKWCENRRIWFNHVNQRAQDMDASNRQTISSEVSGVQQAIAEAQSVKNAIYSSNVLQDRAKANVGNINAQSTYSPSMDLALMDSPKTATLKSHKVDVYNNGHKETVDINQIPPFTTAYIVQQSQDEIQQIMESGPYCIVSTNDGTKYYVSNMEQAMNIKNAIEKTVRSKMEMSWVQGDGTTSSKSLKTVTTFYAASTGCTASIQQMPQSPVLANKTLPSYDSQSQYTATVPKKQDTSAVSSASNDDTTTPLPKPEGFGSGVVKKKK